MRCRTRQRARRSPQIRKSVVAIGAIYVNENICFRGRVICRQRQT